LGKSYAFTKEQGKQTAAIKACHVLTKKTRGYGGEKTQEYTEAKFTRP